MQPAKGNALEIARNFRMLKQKTTSKVSTVSKAVVKTTVTDNPTVMPGMSAIYIVPDIYIICDRACKNRPCERKKIADF